MATKNTGIIQQQQQAARNPNAVVLRQAIQQMQKTGQIAAALPANISVERFVRIILSALSAVPKLAECEQSTFLGSVMQSAALGLEPNTPMGLAWILPYWNSKKGYYEAQFQIGYKGLKELAYRSDHVSHVDANVVYDNDTFRYSYGTNAELVHIPALEDRGAVRGYYGIYKTTQGEYGYKYMSKAEALKHGENRSKTFKNGPWQTDPDWMGLKTALKQALKLAPLSAEVQRAVAADGTVKRYNENAEIELLDQRADTIIDSNGEVLNYNEQSGTYVPFADEPETTSQEATAYGQKDIA